jgi:hypothetical protein
VTDLRRIKRRRVRSYEALPEGDSVRLLRLESVLGPNALLQHEGFKLTVYNNRRHVYALRLPSIVTETTTQMRRPRPLAMQTWLWRSEIKLLKSGRIQMLMFGVCTRRARMAVLWHSSFGQFISRM